MKLDEVKKMPIFFVVAMGRSGTTLLQNVLDANTATIVPLESMFVLYLKKKYLNCKNWDTKKVDEFIRDLYREAWFKKAWNVSRPLLRERLQSIPKEELSFPLLCKYVYLTYSSVFEKKGIKIIGDKNPQYSNFTEDLLEVFPDAKFIHLVRDYRSVIASNKKYFRLKNVAILARKWEMCNRRIKKTKQRIPTIFYTLQYEDFVQTPEYYTQQICSFLGIDFQSEMLHFQTKATAYFELQTPGFSKVHTKLIKPISKNENNWKKKLSEKEQKIVDFIAGDYASKFGYIKNNNEKNIKYTYLFFNAVFRHSWHIRVTKTYYKLPFFIRKGISGISMKLYEWFGYSNFYQKEIDRIK